MWRLEQDAGETDQSEDDNSSILEGFKMAAKEIKVYVVALMLICVASSASVLNFFPTVVETLGYGRTETLLLTAPPYVSHQNNEGQDQVADTTSRFFACSHRASLRGTQIAPARGTSIARRRSTLLSSPSSLRHQPQQLCRGTSPSCSWSQAFGRAGLWCLLGPPVPFRGRQQSVLQHWP